MKCRTVLNWYKQNNYWFNKIAMLNMLVKGNPSNRTPSIMDSPTLARVERARLRLEASKSDKREDSLERSILDPKVWILFYIFARKSFSSNSLGRLQGVWRSPSNCSIHLKFCIVRPVFDLNKIGAVSGTKYNLTFK